MKKVRSLNDQEESVKLAIEEACHVGRRHGVGVIVMGDPCDFAKWEEKEEARRVVPDPQRLDEFIAVQLQPDGSRPDSPCPSLGRGPGASPATGPGPSTKSRYIASSSGTVPTGGGDQALRVGTHADLGISFSVVFVVTRCVATACALDVPCLIRGGKAATSPAGHLSARASRRRFGLSVSGCQAPVLTLWGSITGSALGGLPSWDHR